MKSTKTHLKTLLPLLILSLTPMLGLLASGMHERIESATSILDKKQNSDEPIPAVILDKAKGIAVFTVTKAGLGIGGQGGEGIVMRHLTANTWSAPSAFNVGGGSIGAQIGITEIRYILVLNTDDAVRHFSESGNLDWNATASGTAGSATGTERITTVDLERREVIVYRDSKGIFGGATLGGSTVEPKRDINEAAYGDGVRTRDILNGSVQPPRSTGHLYDLLNHRSS